MAQKPNILFLFTDQQRHDSLGCYGSAVAQTPNWDRLAEQGVVFENCYAQNPLCCPSRYSLLTGRYPHAHRVRANWYAPREGERSFAHQVNRVGYHTAALGKMHLTPWHDNFGFDGRIIAEAKFHINCPDDYDSFLRRHGYSRAELYDFSDPNYVAQCTAVKSRVPQEYHIDTFVGRSACEYLKHVSTTEPFCVFSSFLSPHNPYDPPEPYDQLFLEAEFPERNMTEHEVTRKPPEAYEYINSRLKWPFKTDQITEAQRRLTWAYYYSTNTLIDDWIGQIVATLKQQGLYEDTIIIYASDHGDLLGDHGLVYKQCFYEQSVKVPFLVHAPKYFAPHRVSDPVELMDVYSTICELAQASEAPGAQSKSLVPLLQNTADYQHREAVFSENYFGRMIRCKDWKMVYYPGKSYGELYNLADDPQEQHNLWQSMQDAPVMRELKDMLLEWAFASEDILPLPVRPDHQDETPLDYELSHGGTRRMETQHWYLPNLPDLYADWDFSTDGRVR